MALVTKNDVTQIFAIQAPEVDLPPTFANYPRGWDVARANNGKPTIKQFNYIQQRTDQNILYIHQNGGSLPYDAAMEYAEGAVVLKDGVLQQWKSVAWVKVLEWLNIENKPTTVAGYGIADTYTKTEANNAFVESTQVATTAQKGIVQLVDDLTTGGTDKALTAEAAKLFFEKFAGGENYIKIPNASRPNQPWIIQWGKTAQTANTQADKPLNIAFPTAQVAQWATFLSDLSGSHYYSIGASSGSSPQTNITVTVTSSFTGVSLGYTWFAIGY